jgi:hypothetical protein
MTRANSCARLCCGMFMSRLTTTNNKGSSIAPRLTTWLRSAPQKPAAHD